MLLFTFISISYLNRYFACLSVCLCVSIQLTPKRLNRPGKHFCGTSGGSWMLKLTKKSSLKNVCKILKIQEKNQ